MRPVPAEEVDKYLAENQSLERDYVSELIRSRRVAWRVAAAAVLVAALAVLAVVLLTPLKHAEAFVVRVDNATGAVDVVRGMKDATTSYGEVVDRYFLNRYVLDREGYDWETIQATYDATALLSSSPVQLELAASPDGPPARAKTLGQTAKVLVRVRAVTSNADGRTAVVRFSTTLHHTNGNPDDPERNFIATIAYRYVKAPIEDSARLTNPLGFQVTSYRVDPETVSAH